MTHAAIDSMLLSSTDPERLHAWYAQGLAPEEDTKVESYRVLKFGPVYLMIDSRDDVGAANPEPGRLILNLHVEDARAAVERLDRLHTTWLAPLEDRDGSLFATAVDPDGNYVQLIQMSEEHRAAM
ncbi:VOC family protein [Streptomonospora nanhaiensis]|uniref:VOC family protein n=1 Tax=Streptomonospora nanhaiensis TaxID=1323731 RepID=UPI001C38AAAE|nr:VOC family protein [Streptomonospora nanhaiensis]MBV2367165.1 VOC family protein [Streptomonospora nanhaiensis]